MKESKGIFTSKYMHQDNNKQKTQKQSLKTSQILTVNQLENKPDQPQIQNRKFQFLSPHIQQLLNSQSKPPITGFINSPPYINSQTNATYINESLFQKSRYGTSPIKSQVIGPYIVNDVEYFRRPLNQVKTIIQTPIPIIHPIICQPTQGQSMSQHNYQYWQNKQIDEPIIQKKQQGEQQEKEKQQQELNLIMEQYTKLYEKYQQLLSKQPQVRQKIVYIQKPNKNDDYQQNSKKMIINTKKIQQTSFLFQEMEKTLNNRLDKITQQRLKEGLNGIHRIKQQNTRSFQINYY